MVAVTAFLFFANAVEAPSYADLGPCLPMQPGDVKETFADITAISRGLGFTPKTPIEESLPRFAAWLRA